MTASFLHYSPVCLWFGSIKVLMWYFAFCHYQTVTKEYYRKNVVLRRHQA